MRVDDETLGGYHCTANFAQAKKALEQGRDIIVYHWHHTGQKPQFYKYKISNLRYDADKDNIIGDYMDKDRAEQLGVWTATKDI